jgi:glycosyltransferase involved in cell wall biosynthesis
MRHGDEVRVITNHPHYPDGRVWAGYNPSSIRREITDGIKILRLPVLARPNSGLVNRVVDQGSFAAAATVAIQEVRSADVMLVESPPLFLGLTARWLSAVARRPYVFHVADPWPDYPIEVGALRGRLTIGLARWMERLAYGGAEAITTPTEGCARMIRQQPGAGEKVRVVPNGVNTQRFSHSQSVENARASLGWPRDTFTFVYSGTIGLAQGLGTLLDAAEKLSRMAPPTYAIRIVGAGAERSDLESAASRRGLTGIYFEPARAASEVPTVLAAADVALVLLRKGRLAEAALPTKLVEALAAGKPVIVSADGEARMLVVDARAGHGTPAEDAEALARAMAHVLRTPDDLPLLGRNARELAGARFDRSRVVRLLRGVLADSSASDAREVS